MNPAFWRGRRVFVTGHTGFKGSWLAKLLLRMGADVTGFALEPPSTPSLFEQASVARDLHDVRGDVRDLGALQRALRDSQAEIVLHLAAQSLVRPSYEAPVETFGSNVLGTVNLLEAVRCGGGVRAVVIVTSDKSYRSEEWPWGYRESDRLGGRDPYSCSKACAELVTECYRAAFFSNGDTAIASARAGNVIGGGDWSHMRLVPDLMRGFLRGEEVVIRSPRAVRPWQHALEPLGGYLTLAERLAAGDPHAPSAWNFGPADEDMRSVGWLVRQTARLWGDGARWRIEALDDGRETEQLRLDTAKARQWLGWQPRWSLDEGLERTVRWYEAVGESRSASDAAHAATLGDVDAYLAATALTQTEAEQ
jgi:CDP-glucose 4,6-dehydratase